MQHIPQLKQTLGISGVIANVCSWRTYKTDKHDGAQIDLMIVRGDNVINVCEMKFSHGLYAIDKRDVEDWERKMRVAQQVIGKNYTYHLTLVTTEGIAQNTYRNVPQNIVTLEGLFM